MKCDGLLCYESYTKADIILQPRQYSSSVGGGLYTRRQRHLASRSCELTVRQSASTPAAEKEAIACVWGRLMPRIRMLNDFLTLA